MSNISFKISSHSIIKDRQIVEVLLNGSVIGVIYPEQNGPCIKIVSVHMDQKAVEQGFEGQVIDDDGSNNFPKIPALHVTFKIESSWNLTPDGKVFKHTN